MPARALAARLLSLGSVRLGALPRAITAGRLPWLICLAASAGVGAVCVRAILARAGHPALPLDDAFIHAQYARRLAEGHFYSFTDGGGYTTGATSPLWPALLAPFYAAGFRDLAIVWPMWALGTAAPAGTAVETGRLTYRLAGRAAAIGASLMCLAFGAFAWFAWSGMETMLLAFALVRTARVAAEHCEAGRAGLRGAGGSAAAKARGGELAALGLLAPLVRPEGALASLFAALALFVYPPRRAVAEGAAEGAPANGGVRGPRAAASSRRWLAAIPLAGPLLVPLTNLALAGHAASSTTTVKWLVTNPYYRGPSLRAAVLDNVARLVTTHLDGGPWTRVFLPEGSRLPILLGLVALAFAARRRRAPVRAALVLALALGTLLPCTYLSFLWNRVRYIWPFATAWIVLLACLAREIGDLAGRAHRALRWTTPLLLAGFVAALASKLPFTLYDLAQSARAIDQQQVTLGRWASTNLPADAVVGVNDTGAIAYFGGRRTFDVVGLTTEGEARYWVGGAGARYEHYEATPRERLPTHFIVYPQWMSCDPVLGPALFEATVTDQSILGGVTMVAYEAAYDTLGSGALPSVPPPGALTDAIDVADLEAEAAHRFDVDDGWDTDSVATLERAPDGDFRLLSDGGRARRRRDRFVARVEPGREARLWMRVSAEAPARLAVRAGDRDAGTVEVPAGEWVERSVALPASGPEVPIEVAAVGDARFASFHYWIYQ